MILAADTVRKRRSRLRGFMAQLLLVRLWTARTEDTRLIRFWVSATARPVKARLGCCGFEDGGGRGEVSRWRVLLWRYSVV